MTLLKTGLLMLFLTLQMHQMNAQNDTLSSIEFNSMTRGYQENVLLTIDSFSYRRMERNDSLVFSSAMTKKMWNKLINALPSQKFVEINELPAPTQKRNYDGARHSTLTLNASSDTYSHSFDDENPNEKLQALMKQIICLRDDLLRKQD